MPKLNDNEILIKNHKMISYLLNDVLISKRGILSNVHNLKHGNKTNK